MPSTASVSAIIVNYNGADFIGAAIESLQEQTRPPDEIIVIDNASSDGSAQLIARTYPAVKLIESPSNLGFEAGNNLGLTHATGTYIALLNSDARADKRWIETLLAVFDRHPRAAVAEGKIYCDDGSRRIDQAGAFFNNTGNYWGRGYRELDRGQFEEETEIAGVTACAMLLRRDALGGQPMFDPTFFMYGEELDLTIRLRSAGWSIIYTPEAIVYHAGMKSINASSTAPRVFQQAQANRNRLKVVAKFYPAKTIIRNLPLLLLGILYWDLLFVRQKGLRFALEAVREQGRFFMTGLRERPQTVDQDATRWMGWMIKHSLLGLLRQKERME